MRYQVSKTKKKAFIYLCALFVVYAIQDMQTSAQTLNAGSDRTIAHLFLIAIIFSHLFFMLSCVLFKAHGVMRITPMSIILFLLLIWIIISSILFSTALWNTLIFGGYAVLWMAAIWFYSSYNTKSEEWLKTIQNACFLITCLYSTGILFYMANAYVKMGRLLVSNYAYNLLAMFPWFLVRNGDYEYKNKKLVVVLISLMILVSMKRGAIIALVLMMGFYFFANIRQIKKNGLYFIFFLTMCVLFFLFATIVNSFLNGALFNRFSFSELSSGSGRSDIYALVLEGIEKRTIIQFIFGTGISSTVELVGAGAHNDALEFLYSYGFVGFCLFLCLLGCFMAGVVRARKNKNIFIPLVMAFINYFVVGLVGATVFSYSSYFLYALYGYSFIRDSNQRCDASEAIRDSAIAVAIQ